MKVVRCFLLVALVVVFAATVANAYDCGVKVGDSCYGYAGYAYGCGLGTFGPCSCNWFPPFGSAELFPDLWRWDSCRVVYKVKRARKVVFRRY